MTDLLFRICSHAHRMRYFSLPEIEQDILQTVFLQFRLNPLVAVRFFLFAVVLVYAAISKRP